MSYNGKYKGTGIKRHEIVDSNGIPFLTTFSKASCHDNPEAQKLLQKLQETPYKPKRLGADRGYDDDEFRLKLVNMGIIPVIEYRSNVKIRDYEYLNKEHRRYCYQRWKVERGFAWKDNSNRRIDRFYEKTMTSYIAFYRISVIRFYLKRLKYYLT